jgi:nicotinamidase-related amidase
VAQRTPIRNPQEDALLTPQNCLVAFIDYQPEQFHGVGSQSKESLMLNVLALAKTAHDFGIPTILTTVGVEMGVNQRTDSKIREILVGLPEIDRSSMNAWEDPEFIEAVHSTQRKKLIIAGLWTEVCVAFPTLDALREGYEVYPVIDAIGGVTPETHQSAVERMVQAGAHPITALALTCELQRDWARGGGDTLRQIMRWYFAELRQLKRGDAPSYRVYDSSTPST